MTSRKTLFAGESGDVMWIEGSSLYPQSNILVTISSAEGERSAFISDGTISQLDASLLVDAPEVAVSPAKANKFRKFGRAVSIAGYSLAAVLLIFSGFSFTGNAKARIVLTGSMEPAISVGDIIITTPVTRKDPKVGDVIAYDAKRFNGEKVAIFSHRIIGGDIKSGFIMKGDANKSPDPQKPTSQDILGVVIFVIPVIGKFLTMKALFLIIPSIFGFWLILNAMKNVE
ncbi:LepB Signal peptidase I [actinobacterium SCGC AAA044-D11]